MTGRVKADARIPVTVVTGALGAGKTTLLNHLLTQTRDRRIAVIVNEFGEAGIDGDLIDSGAEDLVELSSGCLCCVVRGDLIRTLRNIARRDPAPDAVVIETTGLANPSPVIQTFAADQIVGGLFRLDSVIAVADALNLVRHLGASEDAADQVALADLVVLNKAAEAPDLQITQDRLRDINPFALVLPANRGRIAAGLLLDRMAFDPERIAGHLDDHDHDHDHDHIDRQGISSTSIVLDEPVDAAALEAWLTGLLARDGQDLLRIKGILDTGGSRKLVVQAVHMLLEGDEAGPWPDGPRQSRIVFIGRNLDPAALRNGLAACTIQTAL